VWEDIFNRSHSGERERLRMHNKYEGREKRVEMGSPPSKKTKELKEIRNGIENYDCWKCVVKVCGVYVLSWLIA